MKTLKKDEFDRKLSERYDDHPSGWRCFYTVDKEGRFSFGFVNRNIGEQYWLKFCSVYGSQCLGFVGTLEEDFPFLNDPYYNRDFGVRFFNLSSEEREALFKKGIMLSSIFEKAEKEIENPPQSNDVGKDVQVTCPLPRIEEISLKDISPAQKELETRMRKEVDKLNLRCTSYIS